MKRRKALRTIGLSASAGFALPLLTTGLSSCSENDPAPEIEYDGIVGIIGAGAAGLYAADILKSKGIKVMVFEASDRVGGRIRSLRIADNSLVKPDFPVELGADRILGSDSLLAQIVDQLHIPAVELSPPATDRYILDGVIKDQTTVQGDVDFVAAKNFVDNLKNSSGSTSVLQAIEVAGINSRLHAVLNTWIGNKYGTSNAHIGIQGLAGSLNALARNKDEKLLRSNPMQDVLASRFSAVVSDVELNTVIKNINYSSGKILLTGEKKTDESVQNISVEVDKVIVTVPVSILKTGGITFTPSLPATKTSALSTLGMDASIRVVLDFKKNFWGETTGFICGGTQGPEYLSTGFTRSKFNKTLSVTIHGPKAEAFSVMGTDAVPLILQELDSVFDGQATLNIRKDEDQKDIYEFFDWTKQPYIQGGVSYIKPGGSIETREILSQPVDRRVFFAGEATDTKGDGGTINGALYSAQRVSIEVVDAIVKP